MTEERIPTTRLSGSWNGFVEPPARAQPLPSPESKERERVPWLAGLFCVLISILPAYVVPPGPLKSYGSPAKVIALMFFGLAVLGIVSIRHTPKNLRPGAFVILTYLLIMVLIYGVGAANLSNEALEANRTRAVVTAIANVGVALYILTRIETTRQRTILLGCLAVGIAFNCAVGVLQNAIHVDLHLIFQPPGFVQNTDHEGSSAGTPVLTDRLGAKRAFGTSGHPIEYAVMAALVVPIGIHFARYAGSRQARLLGIVAAGCAAMAIPASVSRSGAVTLAAALAFYALTLKLRELGWALLAGAVIAAGVAIAFPHNASALWGTITNSAEDDSVLDRISDYAKVSQTFREHPLFGLGLGGTPPGDYGVLDNEWLQAAVQGGSMGLLAMTLLAVGGLFGMASALRRAGTVRERDQVYTIGALWIGLLAASFTFDIFSFQQATLVTFLLFGLLWSGVAVPFPDPSGAAGGVVAAAPKNLDGAAVGRA